MGSFSENHDQPRFPSYNPDISVSAWIPDSIVQTVIDLSEVSKERHRIYHAHWRDPHKYNFSSA